jgi:hypothetical protein
MSTKKTKKPVAKKQIVGTYNSYLFNRVFMIVSFNGVPAKNSTHKEESTIFILCRLRPVQNACLSL